MIVKTIFHETILLNLKVHNPVASGVYLYTLKAESYTETRKLLLIR